MDVFPESSPFQTYKLTCSPRHTLTRTVNRQRGRDKNKKMLTDKGGVNIKLHAVYVVKMLENRILNC